LTWATQNQTKRGIFAHWGGGEEKEEKTGRGGNPSLRFQRQYKKMQRGGGTGGTRGGGIFSGEAVGITRFLVQKGETTKGMGGGVSSKGGTLVSGDSF